MEFNIQQLIDEVEASSFLQTMKNIGCKDEDIKMLETLINCFRKHGVNTHSIISALTEFTIMFLDKFEEEGESSE